ncbi:hypothetical protein VB711_00070 [Cronbergia sp. UHCC 0137]|uniref:hypothetical protein n=1 Tax=Cronbergia sp. UHCC 0137 TaxID=3110239 RepID=UPI002B204846|nr:hypothetical protein [Cronbergia sp. UHCC 0137]MEA5616238.1 hypothetical protein [Cronbergia sp. UHCC 0137]
MKRFFTGIFVITTLLLSSSCSSDIKSGDQINHNSMNHDEHTQMETSQAELILPQNIAANLPLNLLIDIQTSAGKPINKFDIFQEKLMHLIIVSNDLKLFDHIHPAYKNNGRFTVDKTFTEPGEYTLFSDYKPAGQKETVSLMKITIPGSVPLPKSLEKFTKTKTISDVKVNLNISPQKIKSGQEISLKFDLQDTIKNQPIKNLKPYLGEKAHLVIIKSSYPLTKSDYIHAHALKNNSDHQIEFMTKFPLSGTYKMWIQFNHNNKIKTADFWVNVE